MPQTPKIQDKVVLIPNYAIPHTKSKDGSGSSMVERKAMHNISREIPIYPHPVYRPPPKPVTTSAPNIPGSLLDIYLELNMDFVTCVWISHISKNHKNWKI